MQDSRTYSASFRKQYLETVKASQFDDITSLASFLCKAPIAILSFADSQKIWQKKGEYHSVEELTVKNHFWQSLLLCDAKTLIVPNLYFNSPFYTHPLIAGNKDICFYASVPLTDSEGLVFGLLHIIDHEPKSLDVEQIKALETIAKIASDKIEGDIKGEIDKALAEDAFEKQREFLNGVLENLNDGVVACNAEGELSVFNRATRQFHGLDSRQDIPPEQWPQYFSLYLDDGKTLMTPDQIPLRKAFTRNVIKDESMIVKCVDGTVTNLICNGRAMFNKKGEKIGAVIAMQDVTAIRKADAQLTATNKNLHALIDSCPVGIGVFNSNFEFSVWNAGNEKIFGWTKEEALGGFKNSDQDNKHVEDQSKVIQELFTEALHANGILQKNLKLLNKNGHHVDVQMSMIPLYNDQNEVQEFMSVTIDMSDIKKSEENLIASNRALEAASAAKSAFLANMSHEIRTPLNGVIGMTDLLLMSALTDEQDQHLKVVQSSAQNLLGIITDILDYSKIEAGKIDVESIGFDFNSLLSEIYDSVGLAAARKNLNLVKNFTGNKDAIFLGDPGRIRQVLTNFLTNAIKFTDVGDIATTVSVSGTSGGRSKIRISVQDQGAGISDTSMDKLFKAFSQGDVSTTRKYGGTGLGLAISKGLVEAMKGHIGVESVVGEGSTFWFTLELEEVQGSRGTLPVQTSSELRILLAEDNPINQKITLGMLKKLGYSADVAEHGKAAIVALRKKSYDLVLMDCQMPEMDGYEATRVIRIAAGLPNDIKIIAVTANAMSGDRELCLKAGMNDYMTKPLQLTDLKKILEQHFPLTTRTA